MPKFIDVHSGFVGITQDQLSAAHLHEKAGHPAEEIYEVPVEV